MLTLTYGVIANYFFGQVTEFGGFSPIAGINRYMPGFVGDIVDHPNKLYYIAFGVTLAVYLAIRYLIRTPFGLSLQGVRDDPVRMSSLGYNVPLHRALAFGFASFVAALAGVLLVWWDGQIAPGNIGLAATIELLVMAVIGGLARIEGAWVGAFAFIVINNYVRDVELPVIGGSFNTIIGLIFLGHRHRLSGRAHGTLGPPLAFPGRARRRNAGNRLRDSPGCSGSEHSVKGGRDYNEPFVCSS